MQNLTAYEFALEAHKGQTHGEKPFIVHLHEVNAVLRDYILQGGFATMDTHSAAWLHDVLEDTSTPVQLLSDLFSPHVAHIVEAVTDIEGPSRKIRKDWTIPRVRSRGGYEAVIVKLCDRIANVECRRGDHQKYFRQYQEEQELFKKSLYQPGECPYLWTRLEKALA